MIDKLPDNECTGCAVCHDVCPVEAIEMGPDREGFCHQRINVEICINCDLCERKCHVMQQVKINNPAEGEPLACYAAQYKNIPVRFDSTSGGLFSALAMEIYRRGGYVGGAIRSEDGGVEHFISNKPADLPKLRQSKYAQSRAAGLYKEVKRLPKAGDWVLVCSALPGTTETIAVYGRNVVNGLPAQMEINSEMVYEAIKEYLHTIVDSIKVILERTPPEISSDIIESGIYVTGGSAAIKDIDKLI